jgi:hypothetical protein
VRSQCSEGKSQLNEALWQKFAITPEDWQHDERERKAEWENVPKLLEEFADALKASVDDCIPRFDLIPAFGKNHRLREILSLHHSAHLRDAFTIVRQGGFTGSPDVRNEFLRGTDLLVFPARPGCRGEDGPIALGFRISEMLQYKTYRVDVLVERQDPLIRILFSTRDLSDSLEQINCFEYGHPILRSINGFSLLIDCKYEFLIEGRMPLSDLWEIVVEPHDLDPCRPLGAACPDNEQDANVAQVLALAITSNDSELIRLISRDLSFIGLNILSSFRFWLIGLGLESSGIEVEADALHNAFVALSNGNIDIAVQTFKMAGLNAVIDFAVERVATSFGFSASGVRLYLYP